MTLNEWIDEYCQENEIELPEDIADGDTALNYLILNAGGGGGGSYVTKPTSSDIGNIARVVEGNGIGEAIIPETTFTWDAETEYYIPNPIQNANLNLFKNGRKIVMIYQGNEYEADILDDGGLYCEFEIDNEDYSIIGFYIDADNNQLCIYADPVGDNYPDITSQLYAKNAVLSYEYPYDIELDSDNLKWTSPYTYSQLNEMVTNGEYLTARVKIVKNTGVRIYRGYLTSDIYFYKLDGVNYIMCAYRTNTVADVGSDSWAIKPDGTYEYFD